MLQYLVFVVLVKRSERTNDLVMIKQFNCITGIFCEYEVHTLQYFNRTKGNIFEIADGSGDDVEHGLMCELACRR